MNKSRKRTFDEIAAQEGEEAAIQAGIEADPDAFELDAEWFRHAIPAREFMPHTRATYSWLSSDDRTNFNLFVDRILVAIGQVSQKRDLFTVTSVLDEKSHSFPTGRDTKNWAVEHFDFHHALKDISRTSPPRASFSWASADDRTNFQLFVDGTVVAEGRISEKRDLFSIDSQLDETARSFRTMQAAKSWAITHFDSKRRAVTAPPTSKLRASFSWISFNDRDNFRLFVDEMLVADGKILKDRGQYVMHSRMDGTRRTFPSMVAAKKWVIEHYCSFQEVVAENYAYHSP